MAWFDKKEASRLAPVHFDDVTERQRKQPSWLCHGQPQNSPVAAPLPRPPAVPAEMTGVMPAQTAVLTAEVPKHYKPEMREVSVAAPGEASRPSMSPAELETLVAERAIRQAVEKSLESGRDAVQQALKRIEEAHDRLVAELTTRAAELATLIARRVIARELRTDRAVVVDLVREALDVLNSRDRVRVHLGSEFAVMQDVLVAQYSAMGTLIDVVVNDALPAYGCVVETDVGSVDESIESRLASMLSAVADNEEAN